MGLLMKERSIIARPTKRPHTFYLRYGYDTFTCYDNENEYKDMATNFVKEVNDFGLKAKLKQKYIPPMYYITFNSRHDVMAFKLKFL